MDVTEKILQLLDKWGIPLVVIIIALLAWLLYTSYLDTTLTRLQIKQIEKELAV